ncbi:hypothetical protein AB0I77_50615 [Streptomyces sp. NPDC050619]|uniref:hypothetical protein n=1 Tax=Streptomyces sp. NPDC050619 TaxID=3157214 RepID=UPI0034137621
MQPSTSWSGGVGLAGGGHRPAVADVDQGACAKYGRPRTVYVPRDAMELLDRS